MIHIFFKTINQDNVSSLKIVRSGSDLSLRLNVNCFRLLFNRFLYFHVKVSFLFIKNLGSVYQCICTMYFKLLQMLTYSRCLVYYDDWRLNMHLHINSFTRMLPPKVCIWDHEDYIPQKIQLLEEFKAGNLLPLMITYHKAMSLTSYILLPKS